MKVRVPKSILTTMAVVCFTGTMAFAGFPGHHDSSRKSGSIDLVYVTKIPDGPTLQPGTYRVTLLNASSAPDVGFYQGGKLIGQAPVELVDQAKKISQTEVLTNTRPNHPSMLTEIDLSGWTQKLMFETSHALGGSGS